jgi:hypothetical protein
MSDEFRPGVNDEGCERAGDVVGGYGGEACWNMKHEKSSGHFFTD